MYCSNCRVAELTGDKVDASGSKVIGLILEAEFHTDFCNVEKQGSR